MRIGFDIGPLRHPRTGVGNYCYFLLKQLLREESLSVQGFASGTVPLDLDELVGRFDYRYLRLPTRALYAWWRAAGFPKIDSLLRGIDLYHATNYFMPPCRRAKRVVTFYDLSFLAVPHLSSPKIRDIFSRTVPQFARQADAITVCSEATKRDVVNLLQVPPEKIFVAYGAVDEAFVPVDKARAADTLADSYGIRAPFILSVGTLEPRKNIPGLIRSFAKIAGQVPHSLVLVGATGWNADEIFQTIRDTGIQSRVIHTGYLKSFGDLAAFYSAADLFAFPSHYEGFGLPVVEAMTCGCPVVCADNSSLPEVAGDAACRARDEDEFAEQMLRVLQDEALRRTLADAGLKQASRFTWQACATATFEAYNHAMA